MFRLVFVASPKIRFCGSLVVAMLDIAGELMVVLKGNAVWKLSHLQVGNSAPRLDAHEVDIRVRDVID